MDHHIGSVYGIGVVALAANETGAGIAFEIIVAVASDKFAAGSRDIAVLDMLGQRVGDRRLENDVIIAVILQFDDDIAKAVDEEAVVPGTSGHVVVARTAVKQVVSGAADDPIIAVFAVNSDEIGYLGGIDEVVAIARFDRPAPDEVGQDYLVAQAIAVGVDDALVIHCQVFDR